MVGFTNVLVHAPHVTIMVDVPHAKLDSFITVDFALQNAFQVATLVLMTTRRVKVKLG